MEDEGDRGGTCTRGPSGVDTKEKTAEEKTRHMGVDV
jgi:hypothetical protein